MNLPKYRMWDAYHKKLGIVNVMIWMGDYVECDYDGLLGEPRRPDALEQFTGLKDNKGVEIFEGDIVKVFGSRRPYYNNPWQLASQFDKQNVEARAVIVKNNLEWRVDSKNDFNSRITDLKGSESEERTLGIAENLNHFNFFQDNEFNRDRNSHCYWATIEVIGNIHQSPGLLA